MMLVIWCMPNAYSRDVKLIQNLLIKLLENLSNLR